MSFLHIIRDLLPNGYVEQHRRKLLLEKLGLAPRGRRQSLQLERAVRDCNFELWPEWLRASDDWTLVDVGANQGDFVRAATLLARPQSVYAFEPQPSCRALLAEALKAAAAGTLVAAAVGAAAGHMHLNCTANSKMASVLSPRRGIEKSYATGDYAIVEKIAVPVVRLDDCLPAGIRVGLLKLDVQGYEMEALAGASRVLSDTRALLVEVNYVSHYDGAVDFETLHAFVANAGFRLHGISAPFFGANGPLWADALYLRPNH